MRTRNISSLSENYEELKKQFPDIFQTREPKPQPKPDPAKSKPVNGPELLNDLTHFIARFLHCSEHQHTILALWVLHTYCYYTAQVTPYLSIQSTDKQSGKTLCLQLLSLLCENPALTSGFTAHKLTVRMKLRPVSAVLLDECQAIVGTCSRPKTPVLRSLLASSFHRGLGYTGAIQEYDVFCPKAFAGRAGSPKNLPTVPSPSSSDPWKMSLQKSSVKMRVVTLFPRLPAIQTIKIKNHQSKIKNSLWSASTTMSP